jgi:hypothetical protein
MRNCGGWNVKRVTPATNHGAVADRRHRMPFRAPPFGDNEAMKTNLIAIAATCISLLPVAASSQELSGQKPLHVKQLASSYPNAQAVTPRIWIPGIDEGWTPQGLVAMGNYLIVTSYQDVHKNAPKCRVFRIAKASGVVSGTFDMPEPCTHAGASPTSVAGRSSSRTRGRTGA